MGLFRAAHGWGQGQKRLKSVTNILQWWNFYTLPKEDSKDVTHDLSSLDISIFHKKSANFAISRNVDIDCTLVHNF